MSFHSMFPSQLGIVSIRTDLHLQPFCLDSIIYRYVGYQIQLLELSSVSQKDVLKYTALCISFWHIHVVLAPTYTYTASVCVKAVSLC